MNTIVAVCLAVVAIVLGGYGLGKVMFERGYVRGIDDASEDDVVFKPEDKE